MPATAGTQEPGRIVIIGAMKCGTTSLHAYLDAHPEIHMSEKKELDFFIESKNWRRGPIWYKRMLRRGMSGDEKWLGEASPNYTKQSMFPGVPQRISEIQPNCRMFYLVRDPFERIRSHFGHTKRVRGVKRGLRDSLQGGVKNPMVETSRYFKQLSFYRPHFRDEQLLVLCAEELRDDRARVVEKAFAFLDVDPDFRSEAFAAEHHVNVKPTESRPPAIDEIRDVLDKADFRRLEKALRDDAEKLRAYTGQDFERWCV